MSIEPKVELTLYQKRLEELVEEAKLIGIELSITQQSQEPLAMRNTKSVVSVRRRFVRPEDVQSQEENGN